MNKSFSSFKDKGLFSKKEWIFSNNFVSVFTIFVPIILFIVFYDLLSAINKMTNKMTNYIIIGGLFIAGFYVADLITAIFHCYYVDSAFTYTKYPIKDNHIIVDTTYGYSSCHHIFPSNWKDITDITLLTTVVILYTIPIFIVRYCISNPALKIFLYSTILFILTCPFAHKYAHEKLHKRYVPWVIDMLSSNYIFLSPTNHEKHHRQGIYNWSLFNGISDPLFDIIIYGICKLTGKCPMEESTYNATLQNSDILNIRFVGDIEGTLQCRFKNNLFVEV
jgi:hypothetical protein